MRRCAGLNLLTFFYHHLLHDAGEAGAHGERLDLLTKAVVRVLILREPRAARDELRVHRSAELIETLDLDVVRRFELVCE